MNTKLILTAVLVTGCSSASNPEMPGNSTDGYNGSDSGAESSTGGAVYPGETGETTEGAVEPHTTSGDDTGGPGDSTSGADSTGGETGPTSETEGSGETGVPDVPECISVAAPIWSLSNAMYCKEIDELEFLFKYQSHLVQATCNVAANFAYDYAIPPNSGNGYTGSSPCEITVLPADWMNYGPTPVVHPRFYAFEQEMMDGHIQDLCWTEDQPCDHVPDSFLANVAYYGQSTFSWNWMINGFTASFTIVVRSDHDEMDSPQCAGMC